jgi:hypothetical protein
MKTRIWRAAGLAALAILLSTAGTRAPGQNPVPQAQGMPTMGDIVLVYGVGGVLTRDGVLWQFRPDTGAWVTVDEAFKKEGRATHVLPLPVPVAEVADMESFGFIVTRSGNCWLYDLEKDRWRDAGPPPKRQ